MQGMVEGLVYTNRRRENWMPNFLALLKEGHPVEIRKKLPLPCGCMLGSAFRDDRFHAVMSINPKA